MGKLKKKSIVEKKRTIKKKDKVVNGRKHTNLKEIMDYSKPFSIYYSGVEYRRYFDGCYAEGVRNFLMSFEYLTSKGSKDLDYYRECDVKIFIDSGVFTYMNDPKYLDYTIEQWEKQIERYLRWAERNKDIIFAIANLDLEALVGTDQVWKWNKKYFEPFMLNTGIPVCFIWHNVSGQEHWEKMCERYPYVGFSTATENSSTTVDVGEVLTKLSIAESYGALVHGMGMTKTEELVKMPFYSVDSTTWKSGLRYGMFLTWTGRAVRQFKKTEWDTKVLPYMKLYDRKFDMNALYDYEESEVVKASVYAFILAETNIRQSLESLTYWNRPDTVKQRVDPSLFPTADWFFNRDYYELDVYAEKLNINPELQKLLDYVMDCTLYCMWDNPDYEELKEDIIEQYDDYIEYCYDKYLNKVSFDKESMLEELKEFFKGVVKGTNDKLLLLETPFSRVRKERKVYVDESDIEYDILDEEGSIKYLTNNGTLKEGDNVSEVLEKEIFEGGGALIPVRDELGRFTGAKIPKVTRKTLLGNLPKLLCDTCLERGSCPDFRRGYVCAYNKVFNKFDTRNAQDVADAMYEVANLSVSRLQRAILQETLQGGMINRDATGLIDQSLRILSTIKGLERDGTLEVMRRTTVIRPDGTVEETQSIENPNPNGVLAQLFKTSVPRNDVEDADEIIEPVDADDIENS